MDVEKAKEKLANLARNKRRAKRRGDPNFYQISRDFKELRRKIALATPKETDQ